MDAEPSPEFPRGAGTTGHDRGRVFLVTAAGAPGLSPAQVRGGRFVAPSRGVRYEADTAQPDVARAAAALLTAPASSVLCDVSAARWWGLPLPPWIGLADTRPVGVAGPAGGSRQRRRGVRGRRLRLPVEHVCEADGVRATTVDRTWLDCSELIPLEHLVAMGDVVLRRRLASEQDLARVVAWARRRRGVVNARRALAMLDPGSESPGESIVRCHLLMEGVPRPSCNVDIVVDGEWLARADLAWPAQHVIVEYDGIVHLDERQRRHDAARRNLLQDAGWLVIVFTARDLNRPEAMAALVRSALRARTTS
jgi:hypothetical protein